MATEVTEAITEAITEAESQAESESASARERGGAGEGAGEGEGAEAAEEEAGGARGGEPPSSAAASAAAADAAKAKSKAAAAAAAAAASSSAAASAAAAAAAAASAAADAEDLAEEQRVIVEQIVASRDNFGILGVTERATEDEIIAAFRKLARVVHPDRNPHRAAARAFQKLKHARDVALFGGDPDAVDTVVLECPLPGCEAQTFMSRARLERLERGSDVARCRVCNKDFGRVFCPHCFASWTMAIEREREGAVVQCTGCGRRFALRFPVPVPGAPDPAAPPPRKRLRVKRQWWETD